MVFEPTRRCKGPLQVKVVVGMTDKSDGICSAGNGGEGYEWMLRVQTRTVSRDCTTSSQKKTNKRHSWAWSSVVAHTHERGQSQMKRLRIGRGSELHNGAVQHLHSIKLPRSVTRLPACALSVPAYASSRSLTKNGQLKLLIITWEPHNPRSLTRLLYSLRYYSQPVDDAKLRVDRPLLGRKHGLMACTVGKTTLDRQGAWVEDTVICPVDQFQPHRENTLTINKVEIRAHKLEAC
ncbi:hypothetical protein L218DRAFT_87216 [Marasmius fiardii PR-910]|nr:hypothetical protein L218DRAFT_87216 [Marasmius fiardii PR-910]